MKPHRPNRKQPTPEELRDTLLNFIQTHFYQGHAVDFAKDRPRLLKWVVLKLAVYLDDKAVTIPLDRYRDIMINDILMPALQFGETGNIGYLPAWLGVTVDRHLKVHGPEYIDEGKVARDNINSYLPAALDAAKAGAQGRNPMLALADAAKLLKAQKWPVKAPLTDQMDLFKTGRK